jgi:hypothetical protein
MTDNPAPTIDEMLLGERYLPFGKKYIYMPSLMKNLFSLRSSGKYHIRTRPSVQISDAMKDMVLEILFKKRFDKAKYRALPESEQKLFDDACSFCGIYTHGLAGLLTHSEREKTEMLREFEVLRGELLAGNDSRELVKKMRNMLLELHSKRYIPKTHYDRLIAEILACL